MGVKDNIVITLKDNIIIVHLINHNRKAYTWDACTGH